MRWMSGQLNRSELPEHTWIPRYVPASFLGLSLVLDILIRDRDQVQMYIHDVVFKVFEGDNGTQRVASLIAIYELLTLKCVPHVDTLVGSNLQDGCPSVQLKPVGVAGLPDSGSQAFRAVVCVLKALQVHYDISVFII